MGRKGRKILVGFSGFRCTDATSSDSRVSGNCEVGESGALVGMRPKRFPVSGDCRVDRSDGRGLGDDRARW
jgi:hypothetical protein